MQHWLRKQYREAWAKAGDPAAALEDAEEELTEIHARLARLEQKYRGKLDTLEDELEHLSELRRWADACPV